MAAVLLPYAALEPTDCRAWSGVLLPARTVGFFARWSVSQSASHSSHETSMFSDSSVWRAWTETSSFSSCTRCA